MIKMSEAKVIIRVPSALQSTRVLVPVVVIVIVFTLRCFLFN
jgi:hypothetical protein